MAKPFKVSGVKITGEATVIRNLNKLAARVPLGAGAALFQEGEKIMATSKESFVPVDQGPLRASGRVAPPEILPFGASVTMGYGGAAETYAVAVHEHPSAASPPSWAGGVKFKRGGPKYLERPLRAAVPGMAARLAVKIRTFIARTV